MKHFWSGSVISIIVFILGLCSCRNEKTYRVWVLHSYQQECSWIGEMNEGLRDAFRDGDANVRLTFSYLGSSYTQERSCDTVLALLNRMERPDLIVSVNDRATAALLSVKHPYMDYPNCCTVVFCGIDYPDSLPFGKYPNFTGFTTRANWEKTMQLASLYKLQKGVLFVRKHTLYQTAIDDILVQNEASLYPRPLEIDTLSTTYHDAYYHLTRFRSQYFGILPGWDAYLSEFVKSSPTPFITLSNEGFGEGVLGGYFAPSYDQAYAAGKRAAKILLGEKLTGSTMQETDRFFMVDWNQLNRFDLPLWKLPAGARIINMPFYLRYEKALIALATSAILLLILFFIYFVYKARRYKRRQKMLEIQAKQEHDSLQVITDSISEGIILIAKDGIVRSMNVEARNLLQLSGNEAAYVGKSLSDLIEIVDSSTSHGLQALLDIVLKEKITIGLPAMTTIQSKISERYFLAAGEFTPFLDNADFNGAVFAFTDQTDEFTTREFLSLTSTVGQLFFWWYDFNTGNLVLDPSFFEFFDMPDDGMHQLPLLDFLNAMNPEDMEQWSEAYARQRFDRDVKKALEVRLNFNGKGEGWWEVRLAYQTNSHIEAPPSLYGLCVNIQNYKEKQGLLEEARQNVHRSEQLKSAFLSNMSHEIRTPLNGIIGFAKLIADKEEYDPDEHRLYVDTIRTNSDLLLALINDILDLARIDSDNMTYSDSDCNLSDLVHQVLTTQQVIIQKPLAMVCQLPEEPVILHVDKVRLNQVVTNLINNAVKFTNEGSITTGYTYDEHSVSLYVSDTGIGIAEEECELIFDRFFKKHNDIQGAGIGLSLCKNIVEHYGGHITVASRLGKGTTFTVVLPR